jgi:hypothetical protein
MTSGAKIALASAVAFVLAVSVELLYIHHEHVVDANAPVVSRQPAPTTNLDDDDMVLLSLHKERPDSVKDERKLIGKTLWVSAAEQMDYYKDSRNHVDYAHPVGVLEGADPLNVTGVFEQKAPATGRAVARIPAGERQLLLAFTLPKSSNPKQSYAVPVGDYEAGVYDLKTDDIFFYDDPRTLYHWTPAVWQHIDKHEVALGMTENQCMLSVGQVLDFHGDTPGDRSITFQHLGHPVTVTFEHGKATQIQQG